MRALDRINWGSKDWASKATLAAVAVLAFGSQASAHIGDHLHMSLMEGLTHPFTGIDHLLAMIAVGLWASQIGGRALWLLPLTFPVAMAAGAALGVGGVPLPWVEAGIAVSVLILGIAVALRFKPTLAVSMPLIGAFALMHGYSHGVEMPADSAALSFGVGFIVATCTLHLIGIGLGLAANRLPMLAVARTAGGAIAVVGLALLVMPH